MARPHILVIPPWFDIDFEHNFSKSYHRWAQDLAEGDEAEVGILFGEFNTGYRQREVFLHEDLNYNYLGLRSWGLPKAGPGWMVWKYQYLRAFQEYVKRYGHPTVIHGFSLLGLIAAGTIHQKYNIPFVYTEVLGSFISGHVAKRLVRKAMRPAQRASWVCGISPDMVTALEKTFNVKGNLLPLYVETDMFPPTKPPSLPPRFISIGSPAFTKGMDILVEAMRVVVDSRADAQLTIVAESRDKDFLMSLIRENQLENHIALTGLLPHEEISDLLKQSHVLVSASREESLGFTILEALSSGRPVVASPSPGALYIVTQGLGQIVPTSNGVDEIDPRDLGLKMIEMVEDSAKYTPETLHENIRMRFGKEKILTEWMKIYSRVSNMENR